MLDMVDVLLDISQVFELIKIKNKNLKRGIEPGR